MKFMWLLWLFVVLPEVLGQASFGRSYLKDSRLCHQWNCINTKLGLPDALPPREQSEAALKRVISEGPWQDVITKVLDNCYGNRTRRYTNTCPGQALMHCVVDQMIDFCPDSSHRVDDSCSPVTSLAGLKYMFSQSRYINLEKNLPKERRPTWFLKNYFDTNCCDLPVIFNNTVLEECGFSTFMNYFDHGPKYTDVKTVSLATVATTPMPTTPAYPTRFTTEIDTTKIVGYDDLPKNYDVDPLDCCHITNFINPAWRYECDFQLSWADHDRLVISSNSQSTEAPTTTTERTEPIKDVMLLPQSCEKITCVFRQLGIINGDPGVLDIDEYIRMLHNFTNAHPSWTKAKGRVLTKCLVKPATWGYDSSCEINNMLACTLDVLTENCPYKRKSNNCKHGNKNNVGCQISSSKHRPKNRREICLLPELIHHDHLSECGLESLYRVERVAVPPKPKKYGWYASKYTCKDSKVPTTCLMKKMDVLSKYNFMDYFKMKDRIRQFTTEAEWSALQDVYMSAFINIPMYGDHCNSEKKLLNVIDAMVMTCPISKRKNTTQCDKLFHDMTHTAPVDKRNVTKEKLDEILKHYHHVFMPNQPVTTTLDRVIRRKHSRTVKKPVYNFGFLNSVDAPPVKVINIKPEPATVRPAVPLIIAPVYLRPGYGQPAHDGIWRSGPFGIHDQTRYDRLSNLELGRPVATVYPNLYATRPVFTLPYITPTYRTESPMETLKPE